MCHTFSIPWVTFPAHKDEEKYELAHDEHTLNSTIHKGQQIIATQWNGHVFVMGLTSPALGCPLTSKFQVMNQHPPPANHPLDACYYG
jgi:hypothetical protein